MFGVGRAARTVLQPQSGLKKRRQKAPFFI
jgi:hypothetical protein